MTIVAKNPLTPRRFLSILVVIILVISVGVPITIYWAFQRSETHRIWDINTRYAQQFLFHTDAAVGLMKEFISPWSNQTALEASNELVYADWQLNGLGVLDASHANQLGQISYAIETVRTTVYLQSLNSSARTSLANQIATLGHDIVNAYWNYVNYTSNGTGVGPSFWYSGPAPPDEGLLQNAVNIALAFERK